MKIIIINILFIVILVQSCAKKDDNQTYKVNNYLVVKTRLDSINSLPKNDLLTNWRHEIAFYDSLGHKQIVFVGCTTLPTHNTY